MLKNCLYFFLLFIFGVSCSNLQVTESENLSTSTICNRSNVEQIVVADDFIWTLEDLEDIMIGVSTGQDIIAKFGTPKTIRPWRTSKKTSSTGCIYMYSSDNPKFFVSENIVIGIEFQGPFYNSHSNSFKLPDSISEAQELYGQPDIVSWNSLGGGSRSVVWLNKGVLVMVSLLPQDVNLSPITTIRYTESMNKTEFENSIWSGFIRSSPPSGDVVDPFPLDPFTWEH